MKRAVPMPSPESDTDYTQLLENENKQLKEHLETQQSNIEYLEENQKYLMDKISTLQVQITEAHDTMAEIAGSNMDLRSQAAEKQIIFERTLENLEAAKKHCADALSALGRS
jgi:chromosome segregation ATPase